MLQPCQTYRVHSCCSYWGKGRGEAWVGMCVFVCGLITSLLQKASLRWYLTDLGQKNLSKDHARNYTMQQNYSGSDFSSDLKLFNCSDSGKWLRGKELFISQIEGNLAQRLKRHHLDWVSMNYANRDLSSFFSFETMHKKQCLGKERNTLHLMQSLPKGNRMTL